MARICAQTPKDLVTLELPPLAVSMVVAELFFKFHSFTKEALAFLVLWWVLYLGWSKAVGFVRGGREG